MWVPSSETLKIPMMSNTKSFVSLYSLLSIEAEPSMANPTSKTKSLLQPKTVKYVNCQHVNMRVYFIDRSLSGAFQGQMKQTAEITPRRIKESNWLCIRRRSWTSDYLGQIQLVVSGTRTQISIRHPDHSATRPRCPHIYDRTFLFSFTL